MMRRHYPALLIALSAACRFGGPEGSPTELVEVDAGAPAEEPEAGDRFEDDEDVSGSEQDAGVITSDEDAGLTSADGQAAIADSADSADSAESSLPESDCDAPTTLECDLVSGEGCLPLTQCLVDLSTSEPAAYCVLSAIALDVTCTQDELSTDCPPQHTCVMGECRKYCYCDAQCDNGAACVSPSGAGGSTLFKVCDQPSP